MENTTENICLTNYNKKREIKQLFQSDVVVHVKSSIYSGTNNYAYYLYHNGIK